MKLTLNFKEKIREKTKNGNRVKWKMNLEITQKEIKKNQI